MKVESEVSDLTPVVMWFGLAAGTICLLVGGFVAIVMALKQHAVVKEAEKAVQTAVSKSTATDVDGIKQQSQASSVIEAVAKLATSMKDLDVGTRIMLLSVVFYAIASIAAGMDAIGTGIGK
jgi:hypothetical protein